VGPAVTRQRQAAADRRRGGPAQVFEHGRDDPVVVGVGGRMEGDLGEPRVVPRAVEGLPPEVPDDAFGGHREGHRLQLLRADGAPRPRDRVAPQRRRPVRGHPHEAAQQAEQRGEHDEGAAYAGAREPAEPSLGVVGTLARQPPEFRAVVRPLGRRA